MELDSAIIIEKVAYGMTIGDMKFGNVRPGVVEATLKPGRTLEEALDELDDRFNAWHRKKYQHLYQEGGPLPPPVFQTTPGPSVMPTIDYRYKETIESAIDNAKTLEDLNKIKEANPVFPHPILVQFNTKREILRIEANNKSMGDKNSQQ